MKRECAESSPDVSFEMSIATGQKSMSSPNRCHVNVLLPGLMERASARAFAWPTQLRRQGAHDTSGDWGNAAVRGTRKALALFDCSQQAAALGAARRCT